MDFVIRESVAEPGEFVLVSPDVATCDDCWCDCLDPADRRYAYPFTNCTNCGPRYTIIEEIPYDRPQTTMAPFRMCAECQAEYDDPGNRRFHAQPNACPRCGPTIALARDGSFQPEQPVYEFGDLSLSVMRDLREVLRAGNIVAIKGLGGFHLACDATNADAVHQLRARKKRSDKPLSKACWKRPKGVVGRQCVRSTCGSGRCRASTSKRCCLHTRSRVRVRRCNSRNLSSKMLRSSCIALTARAIANPRRCRSSSARFADPPTPRVVAGDELDITAFEISSSEVEA